MIVKRLPLAYKRRGGPLAAGGRQMVADLHIFAFTTILVSRLNQTSGTWRPHLLSRHTCSPLYKHYGATQYSALSTPLLGVRLTTRTRIKPRVIVLLSTGHREIDLSARNI
jgi:hypothetical protein